MTLIASGLWGGVTWFISELEKMKATMAEQNVPVAEAEKVADSKIGESKEDTEPKGSEEKKKD